MSLGRPPQTSAVVGHFQFDDPCLHELAIPGNCLIEPLDRRYHVDFRFVRTPGVFLQQVHTDCNYRNRSYTYSGFLTVFVPIRQAPETTLWNSRYEAGGLPCTLPGPADLKFAAGQAHFIAFIGLDRLHALVPANTAEILERFAAGRLLPAGPGAAAWLAQRLGSMVGELQRQPGALRHPEAVWSFQDDLVAAVAEAVEPPARRPGRPRRESRAAGLRRAMEFLQHKGPVGVGVPDLASAAAVSPRTLERAFQETFDITARDYLRQQRLHAARRDLLLSRKGEVRVAEVAWRQGFFELGQFALAYNRRFGELPSETLAREPSPRDRLAWRLA